MRLPPNHRGLSALYAVTLAVALVVTFGLAASSSEARGKARIVVSPARVQAPQKVRFAARAPRAAKRVVFYVDGRRRWVDRSPRWQFGRTGYLRTTRMKAGRHRLMVRVKTRYGRATRATRVVRISQHPLFDGQSRADFAWMLNPRAITEVTDPIGSDSVLRFSVPGRTGRSTRPPTP